MLVLSECERRWRIEASDCCDSATPVCKELDCARQRWAHAVGVIVVVIVGTAPAIKKPVDAQTVCQEGTGAARTGEP